MDRRKFLGLLGAAGAAALYVPKRSYFFGPWTPEQPTSKLVECRLTYPEWRNGELVSVIEEWCPEHLRWVLDQVDHGVLSRGAAAELLFPQPNTITETMAETMHYPHWGPVRIEDVDPKIIRPVWRYGKLTEVHVAR